MFSEKDNSSYLEEEQDNSPRSDATDDLMFQVDEDYEDQQWFNARAEKILDPVFDQAIDSLLLQFVDDHLQLTLLMAILKGNYPETTFKLSESIAERIFTVIHRQNFYLPTRPYPLYIKADEAVALTLQEIFKLLVRVPAQSLMSANFTQLFISAFIVASKNIHATDGNDWNSQDYARALKISTKDLNQFEGEFLKRIDYAIPVFPAIPPTLNINTLSSSLQLPHAVAKAQSLNPNIITIPKAPLIP